MKQLDKLLRVFLISILFITSSIQILANQNEVTEGREYWIGVPHCRTVMGEPIRFGEYPIMLWMSSKVNTTARVTAEAIAYTRNFQIEKNKTTIVELPDILMPKESEEIMPYGVHIEAEDPITVAVYLAYKWTGEAYRCIPMEWLGREYVTTNLYLDQTDQFKPPQILLVANEDKTVVTYVPTAHTVKVNKGVPKTVTLNRGDVYLIEGRVEGQEGFKREWVTDLTGTYIKSTKPIGVISGHTKGAFPRYQRGMPSNYMERWANFMRNMLCEMMWPIELLGKEYLSAPIKYNDRTRGLSYATDDYGDLIRFVATQDNTDIYQLRQDGSGYMKISPTLKKGQWYNIDNQEKAALYRATKPVLCAQYGKAWMNEQVPSGADEGTKKDKPENQIQNPHKNGEGMLIVLAPLDRWTGYAQFRSPSGIDNFVYVTCKEDAIDHLKFDGQLFTAKFGNAITGIAGTDYVFVTEALGSGDHYIEADSGYKFAAYAYGNWDYTKDGFAYGYPTGINYASICTDSLYVLDKMLCGDVAGTAYVVPPDSSCAVLFNILFYSSKSYNYEFTVEDFSRETAKVANFWLKVIDKTKPAKGVVTAMSRSGLSVTKTYEYFPEDLTAQPTLLNFGTLKVGDKKCMNVDFTNPSTSPVSVTIKNFKLKTGKPEFQLESKNLPITVAPGETVSLEICATALATTANYVEDSLIVELSCFEKTLVKLELRTGEQIIWIGDATWLNIPVGQERPKQVEIHNQGSLPAELYSIDWPDKLHFTRVEGLNFPLKLNPDEHYFFTVYYKPDVAGVQHQTRADFTGSTDVIKLYSDWIGNGIDAGPYIEGMDWMKKRVIDNYSINKLGVTEYEGIVTIGNTGTWLLDYVGIIIENDFNGVFRIDTTSKPTQLKPNEPFTFKVYFAPKPDGQDNFTDYTSKITFISMFDNNIMKAEAILHGAEMQPHIDITGYDFSPAILVGSTKQGNGSVISVIKNEDSKMTLTVDSLWIEGPDKAAFEIDPTFLVGLFPLKLQPGNNLDIPVTFTALKSGQHTAQIKAIHDAPEDPAGPLVGYGNTQGLKPSDRDFGIHFITTNSPQNFVTLVNTGTQDVTVTSPLMVTGADRNAFTIQSWYLASNKTALNPQPPFTFPGLDTLYVFLTFKPDEVKKYSAQLQYVTSIGDTVSNLFGEGMIIRGVCRIPTTYHVYTGNQATIDVLLENHPNEQKAFEQANLQEFEVFVKFKIDGRDPALQDVFPDVTGPQDIITAGTLTEGWTVVNANILSGKTLQVVFQGTKALKGPGTLFKFRLNTFLTDLNVIPLPVDMRPVARPYIFIDTIPGQIQIDPVCVNTLRLIKISGTKYMLSDAVPNPAGDKASIEYSISFDSPTTITLYNSYGSKVATLVNQELKAGSYDLQIDINALGLPSGAYKYQIESGQFKDTKSLVITR